MSLLSINRRKLLALMASAIGPAFLPGRSRAAATTQPTEPKILQPRLADGTLPPMPERLPKNPRVVTFSKPGLGPGRYGDALRMAIGGQKDIRYMTVNGYARLIGYSAELAFEPDILAGYEEVEDRIYTLHLREGHRWSDGTPFTSEDFRYCLEDVLLDPEIKPGGLLPDLLADGKPPRFKVIDPLTVRYAWETPNPRFLSRLASPNPLELALPAHYLKQFHKKYQDPETLAKLIKQNKVQTWTDLHTKMSRTYRPDNPDLPTLAPWRNTVAPPAERFVFERNPYFHRVDENGLQLPYMDRILLHVSEGSLIAAKAGAGESDLQSQGLDFLDYTFLKNAEANHPLTVRLWKQTLGSRVALYPNLNCSDPVWRGLMRDPRMRRALSIGISRREINEVLFFGLCQESADTVLPESPLFNAKYRDAWTQYDPDLARSLLDAIGLDRKSDDGIRLLPDGSPATLTVESASDGTLESDVLELIGDHWRDIGISLFIRSSSRDVFTSRVRSGEAVMSIFMGLDNGVPTADMPPSELTPSRDDQLHWPSFGTYRLSSGQMGEAPDIPEVKQLWDLFDSWMNSTTHEMRAAIWAQMLDIYTQQVFSIGLINGTLQPIVHHRRLRNVPEKALYGYDPTSFFGIYKPDTFWLDDEG